MESMERKMREMQGGVDADQALAMGAHTVCAFASCLFSGAVQRACPEVGAPRPKSANRAGPERAINCGVVDRCARLSASVCRNAMLGEHRTTIDAR